MQVSCFRVGVLALIALPLSSCAKHHEEHHEAAHKITATTPVAKDVTITQQYVCQIHSQKHIDVRALERGYLEAITVKEGQTVKANDVLFKVFPAIYKAKYDAEMAEAQVAQLEYNNAKSLFDKKVVSQNELMLLQAKLQKAQANAKMAETELNFTNITSPFDGIIDRLQHQHGSLIEEGEILTTLSDNKVMWVYFNVTESRYLEYKAKLEQHKDDLVIDLVLANGETFQYPGKIGAVEADFNNETGNIQFRADFPNPDGLLRHGQTGTVLIHRVMDNAIVIPQRAAFEVLAKRYVYVVGDDNVAHQRDITVENELDDIYLIKDGLAVNDKIVLEGIRQIRDGSKVECEIEPAEEVLKNLKYHAE
jgi:membrane fusion protein (multidrug efflux system)